jgi:hypothetical protein
VRSEAQSNRKMVPKIGKQQIKIMAKPEKKMIPVNESVELQHNDKY